MVKPTTHQDSMTSVLKSEITAESSTAWDGKKLDLYNASKILRMSPLNW